MISGEVNHRILRVDDVNVNDNASIAAEFINSSINDDARALKVRGKSEFLGSINAGTNGTLSMGGDSAQVSIGQLNHRTTVEGDMRIIEEVRIGNFQGSGMIDANGDPNGQSLKIGSDISTSDVEIGRSGYKVVIKTNLLGASGTLSVGPSDNVGKIDSGGTGVAAKALHIGTGIQTAGVKIGRSGQDVINDANLGIQGDLFVGSTSSAGKINSGGTAVSPQDLKIGGDSVTSTVILGRSGKTIDFNGLLRTLGNGILLLGNSISDTGAVAIVPNSTGHGNGPAIDIYFSGVQSRYVDATGWF
ncbi:MAG: hypothetical protein FJY67_02505 [Calditrichaeota bacterium]|nr:hypothetical protein [Calditrichota bacterium]